MYYVYFIKSSQDNSTYVGYTSDLKKRIKQHNKLRSRYTKTKAPYNLIYYEAYILKTAAIKREEEVLKRLGPIV